MKSQICPIDNAISKLPNVSKSYVKARSYPPLSM